MAREVIQYLEVDRLSLKPQVRDRADDDTIAGLAASMQAVGQLLPIRVRCIGERWIIVEGERRYRGACLLGWAEIAAIVEERELCEAEVVQRQLIANCQRKNLSGLEAARAIDELIRTTGWNGSEAAAQLGFSNATVSRLLALLKLPEAVQNRVANGELPASTAYELRKLGDGAKQSEIADAAANGKLTREAVKRRASSKSSFHTRPKAVPLPTVVADLGAKRSVTVRGPGLSDIETLLAWIDEVVVSLRQAITDGITISELPSLFKKRSAQGGV